MTHRTTQRSQDRPLAMRSDGFTLIELVMVMIILAILIAMSMPYLLGSKNAVRFKSTVTAARAYDDAVSAYKLQNRDRNPVEGTAQWAGNEGPIDVLNRPYLRGGVPETVDSRQVKLDFGTAGPPTGNYHGQVVYRRFDNFQYAFLVRVKEKGTWKDKCTVSNVSSPPLGVPAC